MKSQKSECTFCKKKKNWVCESKYFFSIFDKFPITPGHTLVIPKRHIESFFELTQDEFIDLQNIMKNVKKVIEETDFRQIYKIPSQDTVDNSKYSKFEKKSFKFYEKMISHKSMSKLKNGVLQIDAYNIGINDGKAAGRTVHHLHIHLIPRFFGDVDKPEGGVRHIIPGMGYYN